MLGRRGDPMGFDGAPLRRVLAGVAFAVVAGCGPSTEEQMLRARADADSGRLAESIALFEAVLEREPDHVEANHRLGVALLAQGETSRAVARLSRSLEDPTYGDQAGLLLAGAFIAGRNFEEAIRVASSVLERTPDHLEALRLRASARLHSGDPAGCEVDAARLVGAAPTDVAGLILLGTCLGRLDRPAEAEATFDRAVAAAAAAAEPIRANACGARAEFIQTTLDDEARAADAYALCLEAHPTHLALLTQAAALYESLGRETEAGQALQSAVAAAPDDLALARTHALWLVRRGRESEALEALRARAERLDSAPAWRLLAGFQREQADLDGAATSLEHALRRSPADPAALAFTRADLLLDLGRGEEAEAIADELEPAVYGHMIRGRRRLEAGDAEGALAAFDEGLAQWPNNAGARFLAGQAAERTGDPERALSEFRESTRAAPGETDAALHAAYVALALGRPADAVAFAMRHVAHRAGRHDEAVVLVSRAYGIRGERARQREALERWTESHGAQPAVLVELAALESDPERAAARLSESGLDLEDPRNEAALRGLARHLIAAGRPEEALERVDRALAKHPDVASLHDLRARVLAALGRDEELVAELERALELDPELVSALTARGDRLAAAGHTREGLELLDRAARLEPRSPDAAYRAAQIALASGDVDDARRRLDAIVRRHPDHAGAANDLAWILAESGGDLDRALRLAERAVERDRTAAILDTLGWVRLARGETEAAVAALDEAAGAAPEVPSIRYRLGLALLRNGEPQAAADAFRAALGTGAFPEAEAARRELAKLETPGA